MKGKDYVNGLMIVVIGVLLLLSNLGVIDVDLGSIWPLFLLLPGLIFELSYFITRKDPGLLVPGGILLTYGILFYINIVYGWHWMGKLWPFFPLGVAIGLLQLYVFGDHERELLIPVGILGGGSLIAIVAQFSLVDFTTIVATVLIFVGLGLILRKK